MTPVQDRPPVRRPVEHTEHPYDEAATRITATTWLMFSVAGLMGAVVDHTHAGYWIGSAFILCLVTGIAALTTATALKAVKP